jgi:hypothetical protein
MKKGQYYDQAMEMYVVKQMTYNEISAQLGVAEKTLRNWAQEGDWAEKRAEQNRKRRTLHEMMYDAAEQIMASILADLAAGNPVDPGRLYAVNRMISALERSREYEVATGKADEKPVTPVDAKLSAEKLQEIKDMLRL